MRDSENISKLLRLKRYERPSDPEYFDKFLEEYRSRQRADLHRTPLRQMILERIQALLAGIEVPKYAYASALGLFLLVAVSIFFLPEESDNQLLSQMAEATSISLPSSAQSSNAVSLSLRSGMIMSGLEAATSSAEERVKVTHMAALPHYVLDSRPASYEPPFSF